MDPAREFYIDYSVQIIYNFSVVSAYINDIWRNTDMKLGIVGLPNVGKSTLFNAITKAGAQAENYPFCTI